MVNYTPSGAVRPALDSAEPVKPSDPAPPPHPPRQPVHFGRPRPSPHLRPPHEQTMKRPAEKLHLAQHRMHPHPDQPERG